MLTISVTRIKHARISKYTRYIFNKAWSIYVQRLARTSHNCTLLFKSSLFPSFRDYYKQGFWPNVQGAYWTGVEAKTMSKAKVKKAVVRRHDKKAASTLASHRSLASLGEKGVKKIVAKIKSNPHLAKHISSQPVGKLDLLLDKPSSSTELYVPDPLLKPWTCNQCHAKFGDKPGYLRHLRRHKEVKTQSCALCAQSYTENYELTRHIEVN